MKETGLRLSDSLVLPVDAITQTFACIGRRGAGKSYLAGLLAEQMIDIGAQVIILDPVGNWWGLRLMPDGKTKGKDIFIIGGDRGDVPLPADAGKRIAQLLVQSPVSVIVDTSEFREGERKRFMADFAAEFFHLKKRQNSPVHLFIDEAQLFAPQFPKPAKGERFSESEMLGAFERIIRLGRNYGIGATLITQMPQSVNKEVLNQTECLCVLQVNGRHERNALQKWVEEKDADRGLVGELPGLARGEGYVWSPSWLRIYSRMKFAQKTTFDSTATPKVGEKIKATTLAKMDVAALKADLQDIIDRAEKDDPKALRKRIEELEQELKKKPAEAPAAPAKVERIDRELLVKAQTEEIERFIQEKFRPMIVDLIGKNIRYSIETFRDRMTLLENNINVLEDPKSWKIDRLSHAAQKAFKSAIVTDQAPPAADKRGPFLKMVDEYKQAFTAESIHKTSLGTLPGPEQRIVNAVYWFESIGVAQPEQAAVAYMAGYSANSSSYSVPRSRLVKSNLVSYPAPGYIQLTDAGRAIAIVPNIAPTDEGLHTAVLDKLAGPERRLLSPLLKLWPSAMSMDELANSAGYSATSSSFSVPRSRLKSFGLVEYPEPGKIRARDFLFPENKG